MRKKKQHPENLITAIRHSMNGYPLNQSQQQALEEFKKANSLDQIPMDWEVVNQMEGVDKRAELALASLESKINGSPPTIELVPAARTKVWPMSFMLKVAVAVILVIAVAVSAFLIIKQRNAFFDPTRSAATEDIDVNPGGYKAMLILASNKSKGLTNEQQGIVGAEGGSTIDNPVKGRLIYESQTGYKKEAEVNYLITPKAGTYQVTLADGTNIYLNAQSKVEYPTNFNDTIRVVTLLQGEAYFDVAHDEKKPFIVKTNNYDIRVKGTQFNINTYADKGNIKTTLVSGDIRLEADRDYDLQENDQAIWAKSDNKIRIEKNVDVKSEISWKDGFFSFHNLDLVTIMKQASRWYDVTVVFRNEDRWASYPITVTKISRSKSLKEFLDIISYDRFTYAITRNREVIID